MCFCWCVTRRPESGKTETAERRRRATLVPNSETLGRGAPEIATEGYNGCPDPAFRGVFAVRVGFGTARPGRHPAATPAVPRAQLGS